MSASPEFAAAAVVAPHHSVATAGQIVLAQGGGALEATIAMAAAAAVACPRLGGLGGDAVWLARALNGRVRALDACGGAGAGATIRRYRDLGFDRLPHRGPMAAVTTPGVVAGLAGALDLARALGGRLPLRDILAEAIRLAREGAPVGASESRSGDVHDGLPSADPFEAPGFAETFLVDGAPPKPGALRRQPRLADTLDHLASAGLTDFHRGDVAREIAADLARLGAPVTREDLRRMEARWGRPLSLKTGGIELWGPGAPADGLASLALTGVLDRLDAGSPDRFAHVHAVVEAGKRAVALAARFGADPDWPLVDPDALLEPRALEREAAAILSDRAGAGTPPGEGESGGCLLAAVDGAGLAVACVMSLGPAWGSGCVLPATGVLMGAGAASLTLRENDPRTLRPGLRPLRPFAPMLARLADGSLAALGAASGVSPAQMAAQVLARLRAGTGCAEALAAPRFAWGLLPGDASPLLRVEDGGDSAIARALDRAGHEIRMEPAGAMAFGEAGLIVRRADGRVFAAPDPRGEGEAAGL